MLARMEKANVSAMRVRFMCTSEARPLVPDALSACRRPNLIWPGA